MTPRKIQYLDAVVRTLLQDPKLDEEQFKRRLMEDWFVLKTEELHYCWTEYGKN